VVPDAEENNGMRECLLFVSLEVALVCREVGQQRAMSPSGRKVGKRCLAVRGNRREAAGSDDVLAPVAPEVHGQPPEDGRQTLPEPTQAVKGRLVEEPDDDDAVGRTFGTASRAARPGTMWHCTPRPPSARVIFSATT
jgi:hypothetical protein